MTHDFYVCCEAHLREIADEAIRNALTEHVARIRTDEREQAAQRAEEVVREYHRHGGFLCEFCNAVLRAARAARGEDTK